MAISVCTVGWTVPDLAGATSATLTLVPAVPGDNPAALLLEGGVPLSHWATSYPVTPGQKIYLEVPNTGQAAAVGGTPVTEWSYVLTVSAGTIAAARSIAPPVGVQSIDLDVDAVVAAQVQAGSAATVAHGASALVVPLAYDLGNLLPDPLLLASPASWGGVSGYASLGNLPGGLAASRPPQRAVRIATATTPAGPWLLTTCTDAGRTTYGARVVPGEEYVGTIKMACQGLSDDAVNASVQLQFWTGSSWSTAALTTYMRTLGQIDGMEWWRALVTAQAPLGATHARLRIGLAQGAGWPGSPEIWVHEPQILSTIDGARLASRAVDARVLALDAVGGDVLRAASTDARGGVLLATNGQAIAGTDPTRVVTPAGVKAVLDGTTATAAVATGWAVGANYGPLTLYKVGNKVEMAGSNLVRPSASLAVGAATWITVATIPEGFRPATRVVAAGAHAINGSFYAGRWIFEPSGAVIFEAMGAGTIGTTVASNWASPPSTFWRTPTA